MDDETWDDNTWPYLAERGLSEARDDLERMLDRHVSEQEEKYINQAIEAINKLFDLATYKDGFYHFEGNGNDT